MPDDIYWRIVSLTYWTSSHRATVLCFVAASLFLYAAIVGLNILRRIAALLESREKS